MNRTILHCDMNAFFASVELLDYPQLRDVPMAVCGDPKNRHGIILAKNELAKACGVVTAETLWQARRKCPDLRVVPPHHDKYRHYSKLINEIYLRFTDMVEPFSVDESWLDVTASKQLFGHGEEIANVIRRTVKEELNLTLSAGVSFNKIFAKMGSDYKKPDATTVINRENFKDILWPLDIRALFFVGKSTAAKLRKHGIQTIGELALSDKGTLASLLGKHGTVIHDYANGLDTTPVLKYGDREKIKSVGNGTTFRRDLIDERDIKTAVTALSDTVASRLRKHDMKCFGVKVDIKDTNFNVISRQQQLDTPTNSMKALSAISMDIISKFWNVGTPIRMLTITGINLCEANQAVQLSLFSDENVLVEKNEKIEKAIDDIRAKFGKDAVTFGGIVKNDLGID